jgi:hypothetical protein
LATTVYEISEPSSAEEKRMRRLLGRLAGKPSHPPLTDVAIGGYPPNPAEAGPLNQAKGVLR